MFKRLTMFLAGLFLTVGMATAQTHISGTVVSGVDDEPVVGASIRVVGTNTGTVSDIDGHFDFTIPQGASNKIEVSYIGMVPQTLTAKQNMTIVLKSDQQDLEEVVVTGYGSAKKLGSVVGAVATVGGQKLEKVATPNFTDALAGQVAGLSVLTANGDPSTTASIRLRGVNSINSSNQPLYILDGAPITSTVFANLNPADIANITVLKDAASTAVYGSRAANGVIVITSRSGAYNEKAQLTVRAQYGISTPTDDGTTMMNSEQYIKFRDMIGQPVSDQIKNLVNTYHLNTDWRDEMIAGAAPTYDVNASLHGGGEKVNYYLSFNNHRQKGLIEKSGMRRTTINARLNARLNKYFKIGYSSNLGVNWYDRNREQSSSSGIYLANPLVFARMAMPYDVPYYYTIDDAGNLIKGEKAEKLPYSGLTMPWYTNKYRTRDQKNVTLNMTLNEVLTPIDGLTLTAQQALYGIDRTVSSVTLPHASKVTPMGSTISAQTGVDSESFERYYQYTLTHTAEYKHNFGKHYLGVLLGEETRINHDKGFGVSLFGQSDERQMRLQDGTTLGSSTSSSGIANGISDYRSRVVYNSVFGTLDYNYDEKYYGYFSLRSDGSSKFAPHHRWGQFWSIGAKWDVKKENFLKDVNWLNDLQLSVNYGTTGNDSGADAYDYFGLFGTGSLYNGQTSMGISQASNYELTWETVSKFNVGLGFRVFDRLSIDANYYRNKTSDMLMSIPYSYTTGFDSGAGNIGSMVNKGFEITANVDILKNKDFLWTFTANVGYNHNEITELFAGRDEYVISNTGIKLQVGHPYGELYYVKYAGVDSRTGEPMWYDKDGNLTKTYNEERDAVFLGKNRYAPWTGGFGTAFQWKGLSVSADFTWQSGKYMLVNDEYFTMNWQDQAVNFNQDVRMLDIWTTPGQQTIIPKYGSEIEFDDHLVQNASFLRMKNLTIQYALPKAWFRGTGVIDGIKVFGIARNLFTITPFKGYDPEPDVNLVQFNYPNTRQFIAGVELTF